ncbi:MAG TPA: copper amine oxidase N-terminal domain-containing protein, partial [Phycisphaerales bacterium]|nr:copper amine oxidase N-terminal domain-containing protein [Phycisphaerales bacterium]
MSIPKKFIISSLTFCLLSAPAWAQGISVELDGRQLYFDQPPAMMGGRLLVPLRGIFEALKADVVYDGATRSIQATKGSRVVQLQLGSRTAVIDGRTLFLDVPADTIGGRTMVPLRFVSEALGADVKWEGSTKTVRLSSTGGQESVDTGNSNTTPPESANGPKIDTVFHNGTTVLQPGKTLDVIVYGEPGGTATFEILGVTSQISLPEVSSGKYQTRWTIPNGMVVEKGVLL